MRAFILAFAFLAACAPTSEAPAAPEGAPRSELAQRIQADLDRLNAELDAEGVVSVALNETADLGGGLTVTPLQVLEDSRCPGNVDCFWEGQVRLRATISGAPAELINNQPLTTPQGVVVLAVVSPSPWAEWPQAELPVPAYRFGFRRG